MKKVIIIIIFYISSFFAFSQEDIYGVYRYTFYDGYHEISFKNDSLVVRTSMTGLSRRVYTEIGSWKKTNDTISVYIKQSILSNEIEKSNDTLLFIQDHNKVKLITSPNRYLRYYKRISYYSDGKIKSEIKSFRLGTILTTYYQNGKVDEIINTKKNKKDGVYYKFNDNGILIIVGEWKKNREVGRWLYYDDLGVLKEIKKNNR